MRRTSFKRMRCPIARSLERVGEWWSILILRDALRGSTRFDQFQKRLTIAPNILTRRLRALVDAGLLERSLYSEHPPRYEYILTPAGRDFQPVIVALLTWGNAHCAPEGPSVILAHAPTGKIADPVLVDRNTGRRITQHEFEFVPAAASKGRRGRPTAASKRTAEQRSPDAR
jgi:DNA-binding HxlR family transcriptional regulator